MMQKISGILPANSRITTVDVTSSKPMRSGVPGFGSQVTAPNERSLAPTAMDWVRFSKEAEEKAFRAKGDTKVAEGLENNFFKTREQQIEQVSAEINEFPQGNKFSVIA